MEVKEINKIKVDFGYVIFLGETEEVSTTVLEILPGRKIAKHYHKKMHEVEIVLYGKVFANAIKKNKMDVLVWEPGEMHEYENRGSKVARVLCIAMPKYDPSDTYEI